MKPGMHRLPGALVRVRETPRANLWTLDGVVVDGTSGDVIPLRGVRLPRHLDLSNMIAERRWRGVLSHARGETRAASSDDVFAVLLGLADLGFSLGDVAVLIHENLVPYFRSIDAKRLEQEWPTADTLPPAA